MMTTNFLETSLNLNSLISPLRGKSRSASSSLRVKARKLHTERDLATGGTLRDSERVKEATKDAYTWATGQSSDGEYYTRTKNPHWQEEGRPSPYEPFPRTPYLE